MFLPKDVARLLFAALPQTPTLKELFVLRRVCTAFKSCAEERILNFSREEDEFVQFVLSQHNFEAFQSKGFLYSLLDFNKRTYKMNFTDPAELEFSLLEVGKDYDGIMSDTHFWKTISSRHVWTKSLIYAYRDRFEFASFVISGGFFRCKFSYDLEELKALLPDLQRTLGPHTFHNYDQFAKFMDPHLVYFYELAFLLGEDYANIFLLYLLRNPQLASEELDKFIQRYEHRWSPREWNEIKYLKKYIDPGFLRRQQAMGKIKWDLSYQNLGSKISK